MKVKTRGARPHIGRLEAREGRVGCAFAHYPGKQSTSAQGSALTMPANP